MSEKWEIAHFNGALCRHSNRVAVADTEHLYTKAVQNVVSKYGKTYEWSVKVQVMGLTGVEAAKRIVKLLELPITWEEYYELAKEQYAIIMPEAQLMPGMFLQTPKPCIDECSARSPSVTVKYTRPKSKPKSSGHLRTFQRKSLWRK